MELKRKFKQETKDALFLEPSVVESYLRSRGRLKKDEHLQKLEKPGEGNMNFVLRARSDRKSIILKQARPWVEKFPDIEAPLERVEVEAKFYGLIQQDEFLASFTPRRLDWDPKNYILMLEDLGEGADFTYVYRKDQQFTRAELETLLKFVEHLHAYPFDPTQKLAFPLNHALKTLNHEHIFVYPYMQDNGFDLDTVQPGLQELSLTYKTDAKLKEKIQTLGQRYLGAGPSLIHGDYYPGSWLKTGAGVKVIDPEFGYFGLPEFDIGVMAAHLQMAQTPEDEIQWLLDGYRPPDGFNDNLRRAFTGVEMMRRIIGLAQLPLDLTLVEKEALLRRGRDLLFEWS